MVQLVTCDRIQVRSLQESGRLAATGGNKSGSEAGSWVMMYADIMVNTREEKKFWGEKQ